MFRPGVGRRRRPRQQQRRSARATSGSRCGWSQTGDAPLENGVKVTNLVRIPVQRLHLYAPQGGTYREVSATRDFSVVNREAAVAGYTFAHETHYHGPGRSPPHSDVIQQCLSRNMKE